MATTQSALLEFRPPVRPAGDVRLFEHALVGLKGKDRGIRHGIARFSDNTRIPALLVLGTVILLVVATAAALLFRVTAAHSAPPTAPPAQAPADFAVSVEGAAQDAGPRDAGRFMLATVTSAAHAADSGMRKVLRDGPRLMEEAKRAARAAAAKCLGRPVRASIDAGHVIGASGGLMFALAIVDQLTPGDLTDGRLIAGTGAISIQGNVGPVLEMRTKVRAAERAGVELFLVASEQTEEAKRFARTTRVVGVGNLGDALAALGAPGCPA